jgi:hypothetical protein
LGDEDEYEEAWVFGFTAKSATGIAMAGLGLTILCLFGYGALFWSRPVPLPSPPIFILVITGTLVVHELAHGLGFLLVGAAPRFSAGFKGGMPFLFTTSPGRRLTRSRMLVVGALPLALIDLVALALGFYAPTVITGMLIFTLNTAGAAGDLWMLGLIARSTPGMLFEADAGPRMVGWRRRSGPIGGEFARSL